MTDTTQELAYSHGLVFDLGEEIARLTHKLVAIHGPGRIARERSGVHLYLPSPVCLERYGEEELYKKHMTVNLTKACVCSVVLQFTRHLLVHPI